MDGVLVVDKPAGPTSHDVVAAARRSLREKRIGHTGTLDPMAAGVLPLVIGKATRLASLLSATDKEYEATVRLGVSTDTYDALGQPSTPPVDVQLERGRIEDTLDRFRGTFDQQPPPYSAKKVGGVPAYKLARRQQPADLAGVRVTVYSLELLGLESSAVRLRLRTSSGFYVRSLAHDLGVELGCGGHLEALTRTRAGSFRLDRSMPLEALERDPEGARGRIVLAEDALPDLPAVRVSAEGAERTAHGNYLRPQDFVTTGPVPGFDRGGLEAGPGPLSAARVKVLDETGRLLAIAVPGRDGLLRPSIVLV